MNTELWPALPYKEFKSTSHLLHMFCQMMGKLTLLKPFEPQWANVALYITSRGLSTGAIPQGLTTFSIGLDIIGHQVVIVTSVGKTASFPLLSTSVAKWYQQLMDTLKMLGINVAITTMPREIPHPIAFEKDTEQQVYNPELAHAWWEILVRSEIILSRYHARFTGKTQPIGFMWGTFDLRDVRYNGLPIEPKANTDFVRRNAMNAELIECGWWSGNEAYPKGAYYSFTFPEPSAIEKATIQPAEAHWDDKMKLFILDYDEVRKMKNPEDALFSFFESTYQAGALLRGWDKSLVGLGKPI